MNPSSSCSSSSSNAHSKLVERCDPDQYRVRENASGLTQSFEDDDEHEDE